MVTIDPAVSAALGVRALINATDEVRRRVEFIKEHVANSGATGVVLAISGGQDSSLAGRLCHLACAELRASGGKATFVGVRLPYNLQRDEDDAQLALAYCEPDEIVVWNIAPVVDSLVGSGVPAMGRTLSDFTKGNAKARARMLCQYAIAAERQMLVVGTDHAAEAVNGFFTKFGDGAADIMPLAGLTKRQGAALLRELGAPPRLWEKQPTADLLDLNPGQPDSENLGVEYSVIDDFLEGRDISSEDAEKIMRRYEETAHKRCLPYAP